MTISQNRFIGCMSKVDLEQLQPHLRTIKLEQGQVVAESLGQVRDVWFPLSGILSCVVEMETGWVIESGMIGNDGALGAAQALDGKVSPHKVIVQVPGVAAVVNADRFKEVTRASPDLLALVLKYEQFLLGQIQQTTGCNALHSAEQRMCKWVVRMYDLVGPELPLTQEFLAQMMGVGRTTVTLVASQLQKAGLLSYRRGKVIIQNLELVEQRACECHQVVRTLYDSMFGKMESAGSSDQTPNG